MPQTLLIAVREEWQEAWQAPAFRRKIVTGLPLLIIMLSCFPLFFQYIEKRNGVVLQDPVLRLIPPHNVSVALFIVIWSITLLSVFRAARSPQMFLTYLWAFILVSIFRIMTITLVPLDAPVGLIGLADPLSNFFYGSQKFITKDLFFSGHTSAVFLQYLCIPGKQDKRVTMIATMVVAVLLLVQHIHYTLDVVAAFLFTWIAYVMARRWIV